MKAVLLWILIILSTVYTLICILLYFFQEKLIFIPEKLDKSFEFSFAQPYREINIKTKDKLLLNGLLFTTGNTKGVIFYLHGNAGSLRSWGGVAQAYTDCGYDVFMIDYRGYGKSEGSITSQDAFYQDLQVVYDELKAKYSEDRIVVLGYSIGTGPAAKIASVNRPKLLILQAPYYSLSDMMKRNFPIIPGFILKYKFETNEYIKDCKMPVVIFHGNKDEVIGYHSSVRLKEIAKESCTLITLEQQGHNGITENPVYRAEIRKILTK